MSERESMPYDVVIVGAGPAGLSAAIRLKQLAAETGGELAVCVLEKGSEVGAHILSGAVIDPIALDELLPDWRDDGCPLAEVPVTENLHWVLSATKQRNLPHALTPPFMHNKGTYTGSLGNLCRWLAGKAEELGVEIFPGFAAAEILFHEDGRVKGVATGDMGVARDGTHKPDYQPGLELHAKYTFFAEGVRGHLSKEIIRQFDLARDSDPQVYGLGIKELWDIDPAKHVPGRVIHTQGWPLGDDANGGGFIYHQAGGQVALGFVTWLNYTNPYISPFQEMQKWKTHPAIAELLKGGKRVSYGARAINDGGLQAIPKLTFPGGVLVGCSAGFLNVPRIKGTHGAMKSAMLAAEAAFAAVQAGREGDELTDYPAAFRASWLYKELSTVRNVVPLVKKYGDTLGSGLAGVTMWAEHFGLKMPFTMKHKPDHESLWRKDQVKKPDYPKPDGVLTFDRLSSVFLSNTNHEEDQPVHLTLKNADVPIEHNLPLFDEPAQRYCPAGVYEVVGVEEGDPKFVINAQNCVHCKTCDIKDPTQNINWVVPEGGGGPNYPNM
ncbi:MULTISPECIES: electron transfer flavoprotein-ubiquinone oxidoreductase [Sphingomonas]|jgi:electron-transferring-flavoprotein dehydrogenase|uniref:Electron transfer flavoprotein-ubiquinone oxidoreductase n=1 Tax=Sphingomonas zeae TaxID=1646122 RepID=A0A7Y6B470_9SPHN|nr:MULTISPECIES: electron transfer flavoprotein-ubiquinone oxidoreductase [Sphingomonas]MBB4048240.1 electron-transferring-flavoprotein dehydrogenase [Sphingomonas zeae]MDK8186129.1 electron transfer flavoprotein-ubiquinone oxidoreductase [Sphingomonas zeae]MDK8215652.1 electron transfer flavoprotein-ubiquinone oxidoreductase [Sphingomonas sp. UMB7805-LC452B]NUU46650.1 electron transfer flavoprotein-ubiquinone oxidoreductase [Sphingomonas zeae]